MSVPDSMVAERWKNELHETESIAFKSLEIRHFLVALLTFSTRIYMV